MKPVSRVIVRLVPLLLSVLVGQASAQESFRVELGRDGETLDDMRPVFLKFESRPLPAISPAEVARRYQKLFEDSDEPEVRIDALNRLNNIRNRSGENLGFSDEQQATVYQEALESYETILSRGAFSGRLDDVLYQMAKAHALTGQQNQSIDRLKQLVGLYPTSALVPEARFRIAEAAFSAGQYQHAEREYRHLLSNDSKPDLVAKAAYMLGWSQFKQGAPAWPRAADSFLDLLDQQLPTRQQIEAPPAQNLDMIEDSFRILALMASRSGDAQALARWLSGRPDSSWRHLLYDRLADLHANEGRYSRAIAVNKAFVASYPSHGAGADFLAQSVMFWQMAGSRDQARSARADYVAHFLPVERFQSLEDRQQQVWREFGRFLGDYFYADQQWRRAADYYEALAERSSLAGELLHLAGDARLQSGNRVQALANFERAGYDYAHNRSADAAWAAITLLRDHPNDSAPDSLPAALSKLSAAEQRYSNVFGVDARLSGLRADLANRWQAAGNNDQALTYAETTLSWPEAKPEEQYAAWLVTGRVRHGRAEYEQAETAWHQALTLIGQKPSVAQNADDEARIRTQLATAIYRQGESAAAAGNTARAVANFQRIGSVLPGSEIAISARFDAANTLLRAADWQAAIDELQRFRTEFGDHPLATETSDKLVYAYQRSGQLLEAAGELMSAAKTTADPWPRKLQAAALYHDAGALQERDALYRGWLQVAPVPFSAGDHLQQQTLRQRLIESSDDTSLRKALVTSEDTSQWHSEATLQWAGAAALVLGAEAAQRFARISLSHPLDDSLARKQQSLEQAQAYFLQAEAYAGDDVQSEVLYRRAELYRILATDLMASEVPQELNAMETMQYQMLLEEEAFPLEERAMDLHARNHQRMTVQGFDRWIARSLKALATLHPGRYDRELRWMSWNREENDGA